ncbi:hypothetical protein [Streptomyces nanshensis]|uniref:Uncharacterized protein n=1 Tax=Streptomyces nanshensis TaxID=518642 RepID=A0A1E7L210_9ACTN|nr:hypothetical protein [Streptomyces nanshensis]OEV10227.1 hypothetical protein AN218_18585 [Streptomyces nanshensis]
MNIEHLMTEEGMREFTAKCRDKHQLAHTQYAQIGEVLKQRLLNQAPLTGDRWYHRRVRAWQVKRQYTKLARLSRKAVGAAEAANTVFRTNVLEVEGRREQKALDKAQRKQSRRDASGGFVEKSLAKSADAFNGVSAQVTDGNEQPVTYLDPEPAPMQMASGSGIQPTGTVYDHFPKGGRR